MALGPLGWEVIGLETAGNDATYAWDEVSGGESSPRVITAFPGRVHEEINAADCKRVLHPLLDQLKPDAMAIAGWSGADALSCLSWCRKNDAKRIVMSETREADGRRVWWKERIKRHLISRFDGALVGGKSQRDYLVKLGMPVEKIRLGYNVVDNGFFKAESGKWKAESGKRNRAERDGQELFATCPAGGPLEDRIRAEIREEENCKETQPDAESEDPSSSIQNSTFNIQNSLYFLASNRFIERKNLARLIEAYSSYIRQSTINNQQSSIWNLCLLGDGELKPKLIAQCHALGLNVIESAPWEAGRNSEWGQPLVFFPGFRQIDELPRFDANAGCFIHPALEEPWGLVINEAMACGLPVLSGRNVGAAEELVEDAVNGWCFDAENVDEIAQLMLRISAFNFPLSSFREASRRILEERCPTEAFGRGLAELLG